MKNKFQSLYLLLISVLTIHTTASAQGTEAGLRELEAGRFSAAEKIFTQTAESTPTPENYFYLGYYYLNTPEVTSKDATAETRAAKLKAASDAFTKGNTLDKKPDPLCSVGLGAVQLANGKVADAKLIFDEVIKTTKSKNPDVLFRIGEAYTMFDNAKDPAEAILNIQMALEKSKLRDNPDYFITLAEAYLMKNEGGDAMNALQNAERLSKNLAKVYARMGEIWLRGKNYKEAKERLDQAIATDPEYATAHLLLSSYFQTFQQFGKSAESAQNYLKYSDGDCAAKLRYVKLAYIAEDFANVLKTIDDIQSCNQDPIVYRIAGYSKFKQGKAQEAIASIQTFLGKASQEQILGMDYGFMGRAYVALPNTGSKMENDSIGIAYMKKAISMKDTSYNYSEDIVKIYKDNKQFDKAAATLEEIIAAKGKEDATDFANLGILYYSANIWDKADDTFAKVCELYKDSWPAAYLYRARIQTYRYKGDSSFVAAPVYEKFVSLLNDDQKVQNKASVVEALRYLSGKAFLFDKNTEKAKEYITQILKIDPQNTDALQLLESLNGTPAVVPVEEKKKSS